VKLRQRQEDFVVEEECALTGEPSGPWGLYRLVKRGLTTPEAVRRVARAAGIEGSRIRYCGLKDRHAIASQMVTILGEQIGALRGEGFELEPLGRTSRMARPAEIIGNRFRIVVRDLARDEALAMRARAEAYARTGLPNYFDEQRYGSARATGEFPAEWLCRRDPEKALRLIIATWSREDPPEVKRRRRLVAERWGDWGALARELDRSTERSIVTYLAAHPEDWTGAFDRLPESLRGIVLAAFQSLIWNEVLSGIVRERVERIWVHRGRYDEIVFFEPDRRSASALAGLVIPMVHRGLEVADPAIARELDAALARRGLTLGSFRLRGMKKTYFWRGERSALAPVEDFASHGPERDELNRGRWALELEFALPAGAYATIFVKAAYGPREEPGCGRGDKTCRA